MNLDDMIGKIICGDCRELLKKLPDNSIHCCVTSPPYWGLRDYGIENQIGLEKTFNEYLNHLIEIFREVKRVVRKDGTIWVNLGDSYAGSGKGIGTDRTACKESYTDNDIAKTNWKAVNIPAKSKVLIPERFAIRMVDELGLICRNTIIWYKRNAMPSSAKDRFTVDFEPVFFFVKSGKYYFEQQFEQYTEPLNRWGGDTFRNSSHKYIDTFEGGADNGGLGKFGATSMFRKGRPVRANNKGKNKRCVWDVPTNPFPEAHFAVFPNALIEPMIKAGCPENGIVLDPFMGSGTTAKVAKLLNRNYIGFDANPEYTDMSKRGLRNTLYNLELAL